MAYVLDATTKSIEIVLAGVVAANQLPFTAHYADKTAIAFTPGENDGVTNDAVAVTMVAAPAASTERLISALSMYNADTATATVTVQLNNNGTLRAVVEVALATGYSLHYDEDGWRVLNSSGAVAQTLSADEYLLRDGTTTGATSQAQDFGSNGIKADVIAESTAATGVTIDGVLLKDGQVDAKGLTDLGDLLFHTDDLLLLDFQRYLKDHDDADDGKLIGSRLEQIVHKGALHYVPGRFPDKQALAVEPAGTNHLVNPIFGVNVTDGWTNNGMATYERSTTQAKFGTASMHLVSDAATDDVYSDAVSEADGGEDWTAGCWVRLVSGDFQVTIQENDAGWSDKASQAVDTGKLGQWQWVAVSAELTAGVTDGRVKLGPVSTAASEFHIGYVGFTPTAYALTAIYGSAGPGYAWTGAPNNSTSTRTATEVNLDDQVGLISENDTLTFAMWVQMPYDADGTWPSDRNNILFEAEAATAAPRLALCYYSDLAKFTVVIDNSTKLLSAVQTFDAGDWIYLVTTVAFTADTTELFIDGALDTSGAHGENAPTLTQWNLGSEIDNTDQCGLAFDEFAVLDRVLTAAEIAARYALQRPLIDEEALENRPTVPGVSAGRWSMLPVACTHTGDANYAEAETAAGTMESRITFAGNWVDGQIQFEVTMKNSDAADTDKARAKLQYYHTDSAAWVDVADSIITVTGRTVNRVRSIPLAVPAGEYEYRVVIATADDAAETTTIYKAAIVASTGGSTTL